MKTLKIGSVEIPINATTKTFAILAKRGAGKTYTGIVLYPTALLCMHLFITCQLKIEWLIINSLINI